ncbi:MAG: transcriptional regulator [Sphingobacteriia bacterium 32-37-4]|nr:MAG: transcriptional regulator [Sphingobacteriia bacterium 32-37-4]
MKKIQMVDLQSQYANIQNQIDSKIAEVLKSAAFINGPEVNSFQKGLENYLGAKNVIPCANGTDALQIAMMGLGLKPGDEVITADFTFAATVEVIALLQLTPVLVDVDPVDFNISVEAIKKAITPKTKAIVPVHLFGKVANMEAIMEIAKEHNLFVIEDNAQAIGCEYTFSDGTKKKTGTIGTIGATSFYPSKNLGAYGDGGAIFTNDDALAHQMKMIANHGQQKRYYHEVVGCNSRLDSIQAAVLNIKLKKLDQYNAARQAVADFYNKAFANHPSIVTPFVADFSTHVYHQYTLQLKGVDREGLVAYLAEHKIPSMIYYPVPGHKQDMFASFGLKEILLPVTDALTNSVISLPVHTEMSAEQLNYISTHVLNFINK